MNECCKESVEKIAADEHKPGGICCLVTERTEAPTRADCSVSRTSSRKIQRQTVEHMVKTDLVGSMSGSQYYYCNAPDCTVVYFNQDGSGTFTKGDLQVKVFAKDPGGNVNVCYCYDWTRERIKNELAEAGQSSAAKEIAKKVKDGLCECDIKNPKGTCCLGDVNATVREAMEDIE